MSTDTVDGDQQAAAPAAEKPAGEKPAAEKPAAEKPAAPKAAPTKPKGTKPSDKKGAKKGKTDKKGKSGKGGAGGVSIATHPRAGQQVRRAKGWGGLLGFAIAAYVSYRAHVTPDQMGIRALAAGAAGYILAWACSVTVWRHLVLAELRAIGEQRQSSLPVQAGAAAPAPRAKDA